MTPEALKLFQESMKLPDGINYCNWLKLSDEDKEKLWQEYMVSKLRGRKND